MTDLGDRRGIETRVYQPAEDSRLLAEAVTPEIQAEDRVLEVGCGSGVIGDQLGTVAGSVVGVDINPFACRATADRGVPVVRGDLVEPFPAGEFDVVVFNPPYLPAEPLAERGDWMEVALTGGPEGRAVIERFIGTVGRVLRPGGRIFLLVSSLTGVETVVTTAGEQGFHAAAIDDASYPFETLTVLKLFA